VYDRDGGWRESFGEGDALVRPTSLAVDDARNRLLVTETKGHRLSVYTLDGVLVKRIGKRGGAPGEFNFPFDVAVGSDGFMYVVDAGNFRVTVFDADGNPVNQFGAPGDYPGTFARPKGIALDSDGNIYVADAAFGNFQIFNQRGQPLLYVGEGGRGPGQFLLPADIAFDDDRLYVVDQLNRRLQVFKYYRYGKEGKPTN